MLATARTLAAARIVTEAGAEPLHTDVANIGAWDREAADADAVFHLALPRLDPPLRGGAARRRGRPAATAATAVAELAGDRPLVMLSSAFLYGDRREPACRRRSGHRPPACRRRRGRRGRARPRARVAARRAGALGARPRAASPAT